MNALTLVGRMGEVPVGLKPRMRELSEGPALEWGFWGWTYHDGSTWAALGFAGATVEPSALIGWAALTMQVDTLPVVGVFVDPKRRTARRGELLLTALLRSLVCDGTIYAGAEVMAATGRWGRYPTIIESCGLRCRTWGS